MKTPGLIEALFQIDARREAIEVCANWTTIDWRAACMLRQYPQGLSPEGVIILKIMAGTLLLGALWGLFRAARVIWPLRQFWRVTVGEFAYSTVAAVLESMWAAWKALMVVTFCILLVQIIAA